MAAVALSIGSLIKPWEGLSLSSYPDIVGVWAACYSETKGNQTLTETMAVDDVMIIFDGRLAISTGRRNSSTGAAGRCPARCIEIYLTRPHHMLRGGEHRAFL